MSTKKRLGISILVAYALSICAWVIYVKGWEGFFLLAGVFAVITLLFYAVKWVSEE